MLDCLSPGTSLTSSATVHRYFADEGMASSGSQTSRLPSLLPSIPWDSHVDGMNCAMPWAPAGDCAFGLNPDSCVMSAASRFGLTSGQVFPASSISGRYSAGTDMLSAVPSPVPADPAPVACTSAPTTTAAAAPTPIVAAEVALNG